MTEVRDPIIPLGSWPRVHEARLKDILEGAKIELKTDTWQWEQTGNLCIEYGKMDGRKSGIAVTEAKFWIYELRRKDQTIVHLIFPIEQLKELGRRAYLNGWYRHYAGDDGNSKVVLIPLKWLVCLAASLASKQHEDADERC